MNYKPLDIEFTKTGFRFKQIIRDGDVAIFHKVALQPSPHDAGFEVVVIQKHNEREIGEVLIEAKEALPGNEQWGVKGWTYPDLFSAEQRFLRLQGKEIALVDDGEQLDDSEPSENVVEPKQQRRPRGSGLPEVVFPDGEFSIKEAAALNPELKPAMVYLCVKKAVEGGIVEETRSERRAARGKLTQLYIRK